MDLGQLEDNQPDQDGNTGDAGRSGPAPSRTFLVETFDLVGCSHNRAVLLFAGTCRRKNVKKDLLTYEHVHKLRRREKQNLTVNFGGRPAVS